MTTVSDYKDIRAGDDLDPFARDVPPLETLAQDIYHLLITNKLTLLQDPDWGFGLEDYIGRPIPGALAYRIETAVRADDRVSDARCVITKLDEESYSLTLTVEVDADFLTLALKLTPDGIVRVS